MEQRFELEGIRYYQQGRKCGKAGCTCINGKLHGPYWYARDLYSATVSYVGRDLPPEVSRAYSHQQQLLPEITKRRRELLRQYDALGRLMKGEKLYAEDKAIINLLGFGDALVLNGGQALTQDDGL